MREMITSDFELFISLNPKAPEHYSLYIDKLVRQIQEFNHAEEKVGEVDQMLDVVFTFFRYIRDKDIFEYRYRQHLAKRLLYSSSSENSIKCEKGLIQRIEVRDY